MRKTGFKNTYDAGVIINTLRFSLIADDSESHKKS